MDSMDMIHLSNLARRLGIARTRSSRRCTLEGEDMGIFMGLCLLRPVYKGSHEREGKADLLGKCPLVFGLAISPSGQE